MQSKISNMHCIQVSICSLIFMCVKYYGASPAEATHLGFK